MQNLNAKAASQVTEVLPTSITFTKGDELLCPLEKKTQIYKIYKLCAKL